jgi:multiple antibiotic resistance protein
LQYSPPRFGTGYPGREAGGRRNGHNAVLANSLATFLLAFSALFSIVNPIGGALIYSQVTLNRAREERRRLAWRVALYSAATMLVALWAGAPVLSFFGISIAALRIAGGIVVAANAWQLLTAPEQEEGRKQEQAAPAVLAGDVAFYPLTMPFTTGPGTISVAIALSANGPAFEKEWIPFFIGASSAALAIAFVVGLCYSQADRLVSFLGQSGARVVTRLAAFILLCVGVQIAMTGVQEALGMAR